MTYCTGCGHLLGVGRFCTNCGRPIESTPAPETGPPTPPAPAPPPHDGPRYPLYADQVAPQPRRTPPTDQPADPPAGPPATDDTVVRRAVPPEPAVPPETDPDATVVRRRPVPPAPAAALAAAPVPAAGAGTTPPAADRSEPSSPRRRGVPGWVVVLLVLVVLALLAVVGILWFRDSTDPSAGTAADPSPAASAGPTREPSATPSASPSPSPEPSPTGRPADVAGDATATVPATAEEGVDLAGDPVSYSAENLLDGDPSTAWRMDGDGSGRTLTFELAEPAFVTRVGLVNGYAKRAGGSDWYVLNRRVSRVEWSFDDGTTLTQDLRSSRSMQTVRVPGARTQTVTLRLVEVTEPAAGREGRDYTPVSEVSITGRASSE